jgi:hypothetical protein
VALSRCSQRRSSGGFDLPPRDAFASSGAGRIVVVARVFVGFVWAIATDRLLCGAGDREQLAGSSSDAPAAGRTPSRRLGTGKQ